MADKCASCQAEIVWMKTPEGKNIPVNPEKVEPGETIFVWGKHVTHFMTCPAASRHRRPR